MLEITTREIPCLSEDYIIRLFRGCLGPSKSPFLRGGLEEKQPDEPPPPCSELEKPLNHLKHPDIRYLCA